MATHFRSRTVNFEERMRNWSGYENAQLYLDPTTALLVADVITAARDRIGTDYDIASPLEYAITLLDEHYAKALK